MNIREIPNQLAVFVVVFLLTFALLGNPVMVGAYQGQSAGSAASSSMSSSSVSSSSVPQQFSAVPTSIPENLSEATPIGPLSASKQLNLQFILPPGNPESLNTFLSQVYDPTSSMYHHFLTPAEFYSLYGPDPAEVSGLTTYMQSDGLQVQFGATNPNAAEVSGTVSQIQDALKTQIDSFNWNGQVFYSAASPAQLPSPFSNVQMVYGLENFTSQPGGTKALPLYRTLGAITPSQLDYYSLYYSPLEIRQAYNATSLLNAGY
ncbi:MAG TPA: protease pro-enzyme activation domain-containing protein [Candidatus Bathyarchaeia archaeon]|nr:protease pro-enzyme activation domain-containing protein [Candidatus Bathyarchaeia archaeon]